MAFTSTFSTASRSRTRLLPRPPTPMIPSRTRSLAPNGTSIIVAPECFFAPSPFASALKSSFATSTPALPATLCFKKLRREILSVFFSIRICLLHSIRQQQRHRGCKNCASHSQHFTPNYGQVRQRIDETRRLHKLALLLRL